MMRHAIAIALLSRVAEATAEEILGNQQDASAWESQDKEMDEASSYLRHLDLELAASLEELRDLAERRRAERNILDVSDLIAHAQSAALSSPPQTPPRQELRDLAERRRAERTIPDVADSDELDFEWPEKTSKSQELEQKVAYWGYMHTKIVGNKTLADALLEDDDLDSEHSEDKEVVDLTSLTDRQRRPRVFEGGVLEQIFKKKGLLKKSPLKQNDGHVGDSASTHVHMLLVQASTEKVTIRATSLICIIAGGGVCLLLLRLWRGDMVACARPLLLT
eukprot:gnl/TRDRNA2_/TRDRNA2_164166_c0_seq2.p1 gnl/TRDRNA2_/TRDRNA2_164166_c0~~gnl/TRDRNA2_/TRDRNA2_164166_c0_seq2.p1  ORF type:complete len:278 (+),score=52.48 gnl/TRDRNA2_/TRDRNA2_164166_c0_seq2:88-921(+)